MTITPYPLCWPDSKRPWREVLGVNADARDLHEVERMFKVKAMTAHPDNGGSHTAMAALNAAIADARSELRQ